ncbi:DEAD/DEAH box helicase, partial [Candidatus Bathyarchaeota archaeon]|nr:DEAD/DEAH box helicase [Candidatus Bathyarchaeota archaeon]
MLVKPIRKLIEKRGFSKPTEPQEKTIPLILEGKNVLLISPTATGKTEAAFLPVLSMLIQEPRTPGIKVLYITPLRALNRDMLERFEWWCNNLDIRLGVRHGDTETKERARQARSPPDILITTPETLQAILSGWIMRKHLQSVRWVIIDEVHELADSKRGSQLVLALERLKA